MRMGTDENKQRRGRRGQQKSKSISEKLKVSQHPDQGSIDVPAAELAASAARSSRARRNGARGLLVGGSVTLGISVGVEGVVGLGASRAVLQETHQASTVVVLAILSLALSVVDSLIANY